ncbi:MAG: matrixin family metalloprotease [Nitrosarchaeum sp.]|nr:matrixin family metalloprotease [Nitrosarchaeum sp.]
MEIPKPNILAPNEYKKKNIKIMTLLVMVSVFVTGAGIFYFSTPMASLMENTLSTKYVIQNLRGDTVDTWHAWKKADGVPLMIHLMNSEHVTDERKGIIQNIILSEEKIEIDDSIQRKGPEGTTSDYYVGWMGALNSISTDTRFHIPKNLHFQIDDDTTGDVMIYLTDTSNPERYSGFTKSVIDDTNHQILKSEITIYNIDRITSDQLEILVRHELGHAFGLAHSTDPDDLMAPVITTGYPYISECDVDAIEFLYDGGESSQVVCEK